MTQLCDANVWVALAIEPHVHHVVARTWFETVQQPESVVFCRATQQSLLRLLTTSAVMAPHGLAPLTNEEAWAAYEAFLADERVAFQAGEPGGLESAWRAFASRPLASPKLWMDAYLAAFAWAEGCRMVTTDVAFRQFDGLDLALLGS